MATLDHGPAPGPLDRAAVERVLQRAAAAGVRPSVGIDGIDEASLLAAADDAGLSVLEVRRAIAHERLGPEPARRAGDRVGGPAVVGVAREVEAPLAEALRAVDTWLVTGHHLRRTRSRPGEVRWERRDDWAAAVQRSVRRLTGEGGLGKVRSVTVRSAAVDDDHTLLRLEVDRRPGRIAVVSGSALAGLGAVGAVVVGVVVTPFAMIAAPAALAAGAIASAAGRRETRALATELDCLLDAVEQHDGPTTLSTELRRRIPIPGQKARSGATGAAVVSRRRDRH